MSRSLSVVTLGTALWLFGMSVALADDAAKPTKQSIRSGQAIIEEELAKPTELDFIDTPLSDVIDFLKAHHNIEIQFNSKALADVEIGVDTPVTKHTKGVSLRAAMNLMLRDLNLTWTIRDEVLLITTPEEDERIMTTKVYDVADLLVCKDSNGELWDDYDFLIEVITSVVQPVTWDRVGGPGSIAPSGFGKAKGIAVLQTYAGHSDVAQLLANMRAIAKNNPDAEPPQRDKRHKPRPAELADEDRDGTGGGDIDQGRATINQGGRGFF